MEDVEEKCGASTRENIRHTYQKRYRVVSKRILPSILGRQLGREARLLMRGQHLMY